MLIIRKTSVQTSEAILLIQELSEELKKISSWMWRNTGVYPRYWRNKTGLFQNTWTRGWKGNCIRT